MANLKYGSTGSNVKELQNLLNQNGYNLEPDGVFGSKTQAAVRDYQQKNNLAVDGIAGVNTMGSLNAKKNAAASSGSGSASANNQQPAANQPAASTPATPTPPTTESFTYDNFNYQSFAPSDTVNQANALIQQHQSAKPGEYTPVWQDEADAYLDKYQNRDPFSYDVNSDALYNQYKDQYTLMGQMAMMDTMGQATAMTGGYGNSYAQTVGQQTYQGYMQQLGDKVPELWQMAYDRYNQEGQDMLTMYSLYQDRENQAYSRHQDNLDNWYTEMGRLTDNYNTLYNREYTQYSDDRSIAHNDYLSDKNIAYDEHTTNESKKWEQYLLDQEKAQAEADKAESKAQTAAELLASAGDYSRLQELYGLTDEEVAAIKEANTPKATGGSGTGGTGTDNDYKTLSWDEKDRLTKIFSGATSTEQLAQLASIYGSGYDPNEIDEIMRYANPDFYYTEPQQPPAGLPEEEKEIRRNGRNDMYHIYATTK